MSPPDPLYRYMTPIEIGALIRCRLEDVESLAARALDHHPRKLSEQGELPLSTLNAALPAKVGGVGVVGGCVCVAAHGPEDDRGAFHETEYSFRKSGTSAEAPDVD